MSGAVRGAARTVTMTGVRTWLAVVCSLLAHVGVAIAQPDADAPTAAPPTDAADPRDDPAWRLYHEAFAALAQGDQPAARALAARLTGDHAAHPAAAQIAQVLGALDRPPVRGPIDAVADEPRPTRPVERPTSAARAELALFQTVHGVVAGIELCIAAECDDAAPAIGVVALAGTVGAAASLVFGQEITPGQRALLNSGPLWGLFNAAILLSLVDPDTPAAVALPLFGGQLVGLVAGAAAFAARPTSGQVALANTFGLWAGVLTAGALVAARVDFDDEGPFAVIGVAADVGLAVGATIAARYPWTSRGRTLVIDAGGIVGGLVGLGAGVVVDDRLGETGVGLGTLGAALGLGAAAYLTRRWDADDGPRPVRAAIAPTPGGGLATIGVDF
jgi:hypothetical protein